MGTPIEQLWHELQSAGGSGGQRRIDSVHPHDIYADIAETDRPGLLVLCQSRPGDIHPLRSLEIAALRRGDGRWALHLSLSEPSLLTVFAALCVDIIDATRTGVHPSQLAATVITRIERWRALMLRDRPGLDATALRGLIGELHVLETLVMSAHGAEEAVRSWVGPDRRPQDFLLNNGSRIEVKAAPPRATSVTINGLAQLDTTGGPIDLVVVRMQPTGVDAPNRTTAPLLIERVRDALHDAPAALSAFNDALSRFGWHNHVAHDEYAVFISGIESYAVSTEFPRLTLANVPVGVLEARYEVQLPAVAAS